MGGDVQQDLPDARIRGDRGQQADGLGADLRIAVIEDGFKHGVADVHVLGEVGGQAVQYGSDAHQPDKVAAGFKVATQMVEAAGFKPARDPMALWRR